MQFRFKRSLMTPIKASSNVEYFWRDCSELAERRSRIGGYSHAQAWISGRRPIVSQAGQ